MSEFIGRPRLAEPDCWGGVRLRARKMELGSRRLWLDPFGRPLLLSAGERGNTHHGTEAVQYAALTIGMKRFHFRLDKNGGNKIRYLTGEKKVFQGFFIG